MMQLEDVVVSGVTEFVRIYIILEYFKIFLNVHSLRRNIISCVITYIITLLSYLVFHNVLVNLIVTVAGIIFLSGSFRGKFQKKLLLSIMLYAIMFVIDLLASFLLYEAPDSNNYDIVSSFISVLFFYIVVIGFKNAFKGKGRIDLSGQWYLLLYSALLSIAVLYVVYKDMVVSRIAVLTISIIILSFNLMLYIFYMSMLDRFLYERENLELKQQMNIYERQIRSDIENNRKIRTIKHDMKHHIREINDLLMKDKIQQAKDYLHQISDDIINAQNIYNTGNEAFDGILNFYAEKYMNKSLELAVSVAIPENLEINIYDVKQRCQAIDTRQNTDAITFSKKDEIKNLELETSESVSNENISSNTTSDFYYLPQSDNLYFTCPQNISSVNIINAHGQTCSKEEYPNKYMTMKHLQPGIYIIHCQLSNGNIISKRIIK